MASGGRTESGEIRDNISGASSTTDSVSASGRDGASASAASCSSLLGPEAALELLPCAALVFDTQGLLMGVNSKAAELHTTGEHGIVVGCVAVPRGILCSGAGGRQTHWCCSSMRSMCCAVRSTLPPSRLVPAMRCTCSCK